MIAVWTQRKYRIRVSLVLALVVCLLIVLPTIAAEVLQTTLSNMQASEQWWDELWRDTFNNSTDPTQNISIYTFATAARFILAVGMIFWLFQYGQKMVESKGTAHSVQTTTQFLLPVVLIVLFLSNQAQSSRLLAYGLRDIANSWSNGALNMSIAGHNIRTALSDQLVTQDTKEALGQQAQKCMQMPQPAVSLPSATRPLRDPNRPLTVQQEQAYEYLTCIQSLGNLAQKRKQEALTKNCTGIPGIRGVCGIFLKFINQEIEAAKQIYQTEVDKLTKPFPQNIPNPFAPTLGMRDFMLGTAASMGYGPILSFTQWLWTNFLEMAMWLSGLFAPLFIAASLIPGRQNLFVTWLIGFLTIGLAKLAYVIVIGIVAAQLSDQEAVFLSDMRFPMALGLFAPGVSFAVVTLGGIAAAMSFRSQSFAVAGAAASSVSGAFASIAYSFSRYSDRRR